MARTRAHPPRRLAMSRASRRSLKRAVRPAPPLPPEEALSWGMPPAVRIVGPEDPRPQPSSRGGANVDSRAPLIGLRWLAGLSTPPIHPLPSRGGFRGLWAARLSGKPAASHRQQSGVVARAIGRRLDPRPPGPWGVPDEGQLLHHLRPSPPGPRAAGSPETGTLYQKQSKHRHINRVEVGVGKG
jgi:hypothetical protein